MIFQFCSYSWNTELGYKTTKNPLTQDLQRYPNLLGKRLVRCVEGHALEHLPVVVLLEDVVQHADRLPRLGLVHVGRVGLVGHAGDVRVLHEPPEFGRGVALPGDAVESLGLSGLGGVGVAGGEGVGVVLDARGHRRFWKRWRMVSWRWNR